MAESKQKAPAQEKTGFVTGDLNVATVLAYFKFPYTARQTERGTEFTFANREDGTDVFEFATKRIRYDASLTISVGKFLSLRRKLVQENRPKK
ncbi:hypothetical protein Tfer_2037 [Thermincola ferriacetica]|uniref:Uncharacterized protein n=1 Tax=Thermincola ferriacetica TaxID=281456 RepID=A0A0L6W1X5_9FIRM|nr:hypothetical protein [Thermincola ferriacetica]KNZ69398.1 hypothetical protein Tfer_2037 [Thermincola ferriacetica]